MVHAIKGYIIRLTPFEINHMELALMESFVCEEYWSFIDFNLFVGIYMVPTVRDIGNKIKTEHRCSDP